MRALLLVGSGGFIGSIARYALTRLVSGDVTGSRFPFGTLIVNVLGCVAIGVVAGISERTGVLTAETRLFLMTGLLGGFTTFSAFALETHMLRGQVGLAIVNVAAQVGLGLLAVTIGLRLSAA